ncbi:unnamed protein product, partial [Vitis vinifera]
MCDASDFAIGAVLRQREDGKPYVIYYARKALNEAQRNYTTIEKELLVVVVSCLPMDSAAVRKVDNENMILGYVSGRIRRRRIIYRIRNKDSNN